MSRFNNSKKERERERTALIIAEIFFFKKKDKYLFNLMGKCLLFKKWIKLFKFILPLVKQN